MDSLSRQRGARRRIRRADVEHVAARLRQADLHELHAQHGEACDVLRVLLAAARTSTIAYTWTAADGEPVSVFGLVPVSLLTGVGSPWLLGTDRTIEFARDFLSEGRQVVAEMRRDFPRLVNYVDARNTASIRWLKRLGFSVDDKPEPYGRLGMPFYRFELRETACVPR